MSNPTNNNPFQNQPFGQNPYQPPTQPNQAPYTQSSGGDSTGGLIPYKNVPALLAYYLGLFSLFPCLGFFLAVPAFVLGIMGLRKRRQDPAVKGSVHAWIGIIMGGLFTVIWGAGIILFFVGMIANAQNANR